MKTKGFSRETEALILIGGGETHSELFPGGVFPFQLRFSLKN